MDDKRIIERLNDLIPMGEKLLESIEYDVHKSRYVVNSALFQQWRTSCRTILSTLPEEYIYFEEFVEKCKENACEDVELGVATLRAAKDDIESGVLYEYETLVSAEVFDDFLDMAEHLLDNGYKDPAASLTGAVLENGLQRICRNNNIPVKDDDNIGSLNQKLFQKPVCGKPQMKQVAHWQSIRDSADHGKFDEYNAETVKNMLEGVRNFLSNYLKSKKGFK